MIGMTHYPGGEFHISSQQHSRYMWYPLALTSYCDANVGSANAMKGEVIAKDEFNKMCLVRSLLPTLSQNEKFVDRVQCSCGSDTISHSLLVQQDATTTSTSSSNPDVWLDFGPTGVLSQLSTMSEDAATGAGVSYASLEGSRVFGFGSFNGVANADVTVDIDVDQPLMTMSDGALTVTGWFNPSEIRNAAGVQIKDTVGAFGSTLSLDKEGHFVMMVQARDGSFRSVVSKTVAHVGQWTHVVGVIDELGCMSVHVNAKLEDTKCDAKAGFQTSPAKGAQMIVGGYKTDQHSVSFKGGLADVRVFSRALDRTEIEQVKTQAFATER